MEKIRWNAFFLHQNSDETLVAKTRLEIISNLSNLYPTFLQTRQTHHRVWRNRNLFPTFSPNLPKVHNEWAIQRVGKNGKLSPNLLNCTTSLEKLEIICKLANGKICISKLVIKFSSSSFKKLYLTHLLTTWTRKSTRLGVASKFSNVILTVLTWPFFLQSLQFSIQIRKLGLCRRFHGFSNLVFKSHVYNLNALRLTVTPSRPQNHLERVGGMAAWLINLMRGFSIFSIDCRLLTSANYA